MISRPTACKDLIAGSRPDPNPFTLTETFFIPFSTAARPAASDACPAANGVLFLLPLKPNVPADAQLITLQSLSVIVTIELFYVE